jgi:pyruvate dehydrogenase (quinone)
MMTRFLSIPFARTELAKTPAITIEMAKSYTLHMVKAIMNSCGDEIINLAKTW